MTVTAANCEGSVTSDETGVVGKADAPAGVDQEISVVIGFADEYSFDLTTLLPTGVTGLTGITYNPQITTNTDGVLDTPLDYSGGTTLTLPVQEVTDSDKTATVTVTISSDNYEDFTATITVKTVDTIPLTITGLTAANKVYDGTDTATFNGNATLSGVQPDDDVTLQGAPIGVFADVNVTDGIGVTVSGLSLDGADAGKYELAEGLFNEQAALVGNISLEMTGKSVAFFYISSSGNAVVRKNGDYVTKMIELAGGEYVFTGLDDGSATGSANLNMEQFYLEAKDADIIIYNSSIDGEVRTIGELLGKSGLLADFEAVKNGDVWCTGKNLFQETTGFGYLIADMHRIFTGDLDDSDELRFLYKLV